MSYKIDRIVMDEYWDEYASVPEKQYAREIADMLLARGETVRISSVSYEIELGETESPAGRAAAEGSADETGESKSGAGSASDPSSPTKSA